MNNEVQLDDEFPLIAIVILTWNNYKATRECIESCFSLTYKNLLIILVDNGSTDGSGNRLAEEFPQIEFIYNKENYGYAGGNNIGIKRALEIGAKFVFVVNNDVVINTPDLLSKMILCFKKIPNLGILAPKIIQADLKTEISEKKFKSGLYSFIKKCFLKDSKFEMPTDLGLILSERPVVSGSAIMISKRCFEKIGFFDEDFFMYGEEDTFCLKAIKEGFLVLSINNQSVSVIHKGGISFHVLKPWQSFLIGRNRFIQIRIFPFYVQIIIVILHLFSLGKISIKLINKGRWKIIFYIFLGYFSGLIIWFKDCFKLSRSGEYLIAGRNIARHINNITS